MPTSPHEPDTSWSLLQRAASGDSAAREEFARRYLPVARAYFVARWRGARARSRIDDALQEFALECFRGGGAIERAGAGEVAEFRRYLLGLVRNVALRFEERDARRGAQEDTFTSEAGVGPADDASLSVVFDRAWARGMVREATELLRERAVTADDAARRRVELLRLRFEDDLPIRSIAELWGEDAARLHHEYAQGRDEFLRALREVVARRHPGTPEAVNRTLKDLVTLLG